MFGLFGGGNELDQDPGAVTAAGAPQGPATPIQVTSSGKNAVITSTNNITTTAQTDASENTGLVLNNASVGGNLLYTTSDYGAVSDAFEFAGDSRTQSYDFSAGVVSRAMSSLDTANRHVVDFGAGAINAVSAANRGVLDFANTSNQRTNDFAAGAINAISDANKGVLSFADTTNQRTNDFAAGAINAVSASNAAALDAVRGAYGDLATYTNQAWLESVGYVKDVSAGIIGGLGGTLKTTIDRLGTESTNALTYVAGQNSKTLEFVAGQNAALQGATIEAINTVAVRNQTAEAQQLDKLQDTLVKIGGGIALAIVAIAFIMRRG